MRPPPTRALAVRKSVDAHDDIVQWQAYTLTHLQAIEARYGSHDKSYDPRVGWLNRCKCFEHVAQASQSLFGAHVRTVSDTSQSNRWIVRVREMQPHADEMHWSVYDRGTE